MDHQSVSYKLNIFVKKRKKKKGRKEAYGVDTALSAEELF